MVIMKIQTKENQTLRDVAIKYYGNIEALGELLNNNPHLLNVVPLDTFSLDLPIAKGMVIEIDQTSYTERQNITRELKNLEINTYTDYGTNN